MTGILHALVEDAAREAGCTVAQILGQIQCEHVLRARHRAIAAAYEAGYTSGQIARAFGRDDSTVRYVLRKMRTPQHPRNPQAIP